MHCFRKNEDKEPVSVFRRSTSTRGSTRASIRGEIRSSMINRSSVRSRKTVPENQVV